MPDLGPGCTTGKPTDQTMPADALVLFGAMGDLAHKKIFPALYSVVAVGTDTIPAEKLIGWRRWLRETQFISESEFKPIWDLCRKLSKPATAATTAMIGPPADSPLWHD
jgi:glucose-6-phosphate dehydrogenase-like protein